VDWENDGVFDTLGVTGDITHDYGVADTFTVAIRGTFPRIYFDNGGDKNKLLSIDQWGNNPWKSMAFAFAGCSNLTLAATDTLDLSLVASIRAMFANASSFDGDINHWDVSTITDMSYLFNGASAYNHPLDKWDVSNVTDMNSMFFFASSFNQNINNWDVSKVEAMTGMFYGAASYNKPLNSWTTTALTVCNQMFTNATSFDQPIDSFDLSNATDTRFMFEGASAFNQSLNLWDVSTVKDMEGMFHNATVFNGNISSWNVGTDTSMIDMFKGASNFDQNLGSWDIANVTNMTGMLDNSNMNIDNYDNTLIGWNQQVVKIGVALGASGLKYCAGESNRNSLITNKSWTITGDTKLCFKPFITTWNTTNIGSSNNTSIKIPTYSGEIYDYDIDWENDGIFDAHHITGDTSHDYGTAGIYTVAIRGIFPRIYFNKISNDNCKITSIDKWGDIEWSSMNDAFSGCSYLTLNATDTLDLSNVNDLSYMFYQDTILNGDISFWDVSTITNMSYMLSSTFDFNQNLGNWDISNVMDMTGMLDNSAIDIDNYDKTLIGWDTMSVLPFVQLGAINLKYCDGEDARDSLITNHNWTITGDSKLCDKPFITSWVTNNTGTSNNTSITIPTFPSETYNYDVDWENDGIYDTLGVTGSITHDYGTAGTYTIAIRGTFPRIYFNGAGDNEKIISIDKWGNIQWSSMEFAFYGCTNLSYTAIDAPDLTNVTSLFSMFNECQSFNGAIDSWNVVNVTDMSYMFTDAITFNQPLNSWIVQNVTSMEGMFQGATAFDTLIDSWNVASVTNMSGMFKQASSFNQDIHSWDVMNVSNMSEMFSEASSFNQPLNSWIVSSVQDMSYMFNQASSFNQLLDSWDVTNVTTMKNMFSGATSFNKSLGLWITNSLTNMENMFRDAISYNQNMLWDITNVTNLKNTFKNATSFDKALDAWNIENVTDMTGLLDSTNLSTTNYDNTLFGWKTFNVKPNVHLGAANLTYCNGEDPRDSLIINHNWVISGDSKFCIYPFITSWATNNNGSSNNTSITIPTFLGEAYNYDVDWDNDGIFDTIGVTGDITHDFGSIGTYIIAIKGIFPRIYFNNSGDKEKIISIESWGDNTWTSMENAFYGCVNLTSNTFDAPNLSSVTNMSNMLSGAITFDQNLGQWDISNITNMSGMLDNSGLSLMNYDNTLMDWKQQGVQFNVPLGALNLIFCNADPDRTTLVNDFNWTIIGDIYNCPPEPFITSWITNNNGSSNNTSITIPTFSGETYNYDVDWENDGIFDTIGVTGPITHDYGVQDTVMVAIRGTFPRIYFNNSGDKEKIISIDDWGNISWSSMENAFYGCANLTTNSGSIPDLSTVTNLSNMLSGASSFNIDLGQWDVTNVTNMNGMLDNSGLEFMNYDNTLISWKNQNVSNITLGAANLSYCYGKEARDTLINNRNWVITGDSHNCPPEPFVSNWDTNNNGSSNNSSITIPTFTGETYNYDIDWENDGIFDTIGVTGAITHDYGTSDVYSVAIRGTFPRIYFNNSGDKDKIINIISWGNGTWASMENAFYGCSNLSLENPLSPNLSTVSSLKNMFSGDTILNQYLGDWDISNVTDMTGMLDNTGMDLMNYDSTLIKWEQQNVKYNVTFGVSGLEYCDSYAARYNLIHTKNWTISGDTHQCPCKWVVNDSDTGLATLRNVIDCSSLGDTIKFSPALYNDTIKITSSALTFEHQLTLLADVDKQIIIDASSVYKAFHSNTGVEVLLEGFGVICGNSASTRCVENNGIMTIDNVEFKDSQMGTGGKSILNNNTIILKNNVNIIK